MKRRKFLENTLVTSVLVQTSFANSNNKSAKGLIIKANEYRQKDRIIYGDVPVDFKLLGSDTENKLSVFISTNNRKGHGAPPLHIHHSFDEFFCVLSGEFIFMLDGEKSTANTGDCVFIPRGVKHTFMCVNEKPSTLLVAISPSKNMENYFTEMGKALTPQGPDMNAMVAIYKKYDSEILGPPME